MEPLSGAHETEGFESTASIALGEAYVTIAPVLPTFSTVRSIGMLSKVGAVESRTVMENAAVLKLPAASVAVQVMEVMPSGKVEPLFAEQVTTGLRSMSSRAVGSVKTATAPAALVASIV